MLGIAPGLLRQSDDQVIRRWASEYQVSPVKGNIAFPDGLGLSCILVASFPDGLMGTRSEFYFQIGLTREQVLYFHFGRPLMRIKPVVRCGLRFYRSFAVN